MVILSERKRAEGSRAAPAGGARLPPRGILRLRRLAPLIASRCLPAPAPRARECNSPLDCCMLRMTTWLSACDPRVGAMRAEPTMTENAVECALAEGEIGCVDFATRHYAERRYAKGANRPRRLHTRPRFRSFLVQPDADRSLEGSVPFMRGPPLQPDGERAGSRGCAHWCARVNGGSTAAPADCRGRVASSTMRAISPRAPARWRRAAPCG